MVDPPPTLQKSVIYKCSKFKMTYATLRRNIDWRPRSLECFTFLAQAHICERSTKHVAQIKFTRVSLSYGENRILTALLILTVKKAWSLYLAYSV
jgi:hypothetical protein